MDIVIKFDTIIFNATMPAFLYFMFDSRPWLKGN